MLITKVERQKRNQKRFNLFNEDGFFMSTSEYIVVKYKIEEGKDYPTEELINWIQEDDYEKAKKYAADYLIGKTEHTIRTKLKQKEYDEKVVERVVDFLKQYHYINDLSIAKAMANDGVRLKKEGRNKIKQKMYQKGIKKDDMEAVMNEIDEEEERMAAEYELEKARSRYYRKAKDKYDWKTKCYQYLLRKGFPYEVASNVCADKEWDMEQED